MPLVLGWFRMVGTGGLPGSGLILIRATVSTCLDLSSVGDMGQRQHVICDTWRAWCLHCHMASQRPGAQLDCFHDAAGYFRRID